ncbi:MAG: hypothetical protein WA985_03370 [Erythrobacter sp.]
MTDMPDDTKYRDAPSAFSDEGLEDSGQTQVASGVRSQMAELEAAIAELRTVGLARREAELPEEGANVAEAIARLEQRLDEQEQTLRHVLGMLIEWLEDERQREAA